MNLNVWSKLLIISFIFVVSGQSLFGMQISVQCDSDKTVLLSPMELVGKLIFAHGGPTICDHETICSFAQVCKKYNKLIVDKSQVEKRKSLIQATLKQHTGQVIQSLWHTYGSACYTIIQSFPLGFGLSYYLLKNGMVVPEKNAWFDDNIDCMLIKKSFIASDGIYRLHAFPCNNKNCTTNKNNIGINSYDINRLKRQCFISKTKKDGQSIIISFNEFKSDSDFLFNNLTPSCSLTMKNIIPDSLCLIYNFDHVKIPESVEKRLERSYSKVIPDLKNK